MACHVSSNVDQAVAATKHELLGIFTCDGCVNALLASLHFAEHSIPTGVPLELEEPEFDDFQDNSDKELGLSSPIIVFSFQT